MKKNNAGTHKKAVVFPLDGKQTQGYVNPATLGQTSEIELLTSDGEYVNLALEKVRSIHFVREFMSDNDTGRKTFLSRPKLDGLWVRCVFRDKDSIEGVINNNLAEVAQGLRLTPPDLHGNTIWIFIPSTAVSEVKVLGVVGIARRQPAAAASPRQPKLFEE